jgi:hypothetical protein
MRKVYWTAPNLNDLAGLFSLMRVAQDSTIAAEVAAWIRHKCGHNRNRALSPISLVLQWNSAGIDRKNSRITFF